MEPVGNHRIERPENYGRDGHNVFTRRAPDGTWKRYEYASIAGFLTGMQSHGIPTKAQGDRHHVLEETTDGGATWARCGVIIHSTTGDLSYRPDPPKPEPDPPQPEPQPQPEPTAA